MPYGDCHRSKVEEREGDIPVVRRQRARGEGARFLCGFGFGPRGADITQGDHAALSDHLLGNFMDRGEHATNAARDRCRPEPGYMR